MGGRIKVGVNVGVGKDVGVGVGYKVGVGVGVFGGDGVLASVNVSIGGTEDWGAEPTRPVAGVPDG